MNHLKNSLSIPHFLRFCIAIAFAVMTPVLPAAPVEIINPSFEQPTVIQDDGFRTVPSLITGWAIELSTGTVGVWNILPGRFYNVTAPVGSQIAFIGGSDRGSGAAISQVLAATLQASTVYTLSGLVGHPLGLGASNSTLFTAELFAGSTLLASTTGVGGDGSFLPFSFRFDSTGSFLTDQPLKIRLSSNKPQVGFDNIQLDASPAAILFAINVRPNVARGGTVSGGQSYEEGSMATVRARSKRGYRFVNWTEGRRVVKTRPTFTFLVTRDRSLKANFRRNP